MTGPHHAPSPAAEPHTAAVGWWDRAAILALGGAGCALSYDALQQMAIAIHVRPQLSYLFPLVIDGFIAYGIRALLVMSTAPLRARLYTWTLFATATTASIWANALHAVRLNQQTHPGGLRLGDNVVAVLSTIAPLALAGAVHLYILITRHHPTRPGKQNQRGPDHQDTTLVPVRTGPDRTLRTGPDNHLRHPVRADHTRSQDLQDRQTQDHGPDQMTGAPGQTSGPQPGPAGHPAAGPPHWTSGPDHPADQTPAGHHDGNHHGGDHGGPADRGPVDHPSAPTPAGHSFKPADRHRDCSQPPTAEPETAANEAAATGSGAATPTPTRTPADRPALDEPLPDHGGDTSTAGQRPTQPTAAADHRDGPVDRTNAADQGSGPADHAGTAGEDRSRQRTAGRDHPADHEPGPDQRTAGPLNRADHRPGDHRAPADRGPKKRTGPDTSVGDQPDVRTADRTTAETTGAPGEGTGLEELLAIAREAALAEGRMTRRALRPYLNQAGVPISNSRFTELQRRLYADPTLAHLPRPGRRT